MGKTPAYTNKLTVKLLTLRVVSYLGLGCTAIMNMMQMNVLENKLLIKSIINIGHS